jgi:hypothetical protein
MSVRFGLLLVGRGVRAVCGMCLVTIGVASNR